MKTWLGFFAGILVGFLVGVLLIQVAPERVSPYVNQIIPPNQAVSVKGTVVQKQRADSRLLLTLATPEGVLLATFKEKVEETDLLVAQGFDVTIRVAAYSPFVENPTIERVETQEPSGNATSGSTPMPQSSNPTEADQRHP